MENPFEYKEKSITTGFYYDKRLGVLCFCYVDVVSEDFRNVRLYNRHSSEQPQGMFIFGRPQHYSNANDLIDISLNNLCKSDIPRVTVELCKDFKWICQRAEVRELFEQHLLKQELYLVLDLFNTFIKQNLGKHV